MLWLLQFVPAILLELVSIANQFPYTHLWAMTLLCMQGWIMYPKKSSEIGLAAILALLICGYLTPSAVLDIALGHVILLLFVGSFFSYLMVKHQVHEVISTNALAYAGPKTLSQLILLMTLISAFLSMWISNTSAVVMMIPIVLASAKQLQVDPASMLVAVAYGATIGGMVTPIGTPSNLVAVDYAQRFFGIEIGFAQWFLATAPFAFALLSILSAYLWISYKEEISIRIKAKDVKRHQYYIIYMIASCVILWATRTLPFGGWQWLLGFTISEEHIGLVALMICLLYKTDAQSRLWTYKDLSKIGYGSIIMVMTGLCIAQAVKLSGVIEILSASMTSVTQTSAASWVLMVTTLVSTLTELCSNTAVTALSLTLTDMMMRFAHLGPLPCIFMITLSANSAFILPTATPPNALVIGTGHVSLARMMIFGVVMSMFSMLLLYFFYI